MYTGRAGIIYDLSSLKVVMITNFIFMPYVIKAYMVIMRVIGRGGQWHF